MSDLAGAVTLQARGATAERLRAWPVEKLNGAFRVYPKDKSKAGELARKWSSSSTARLEGRGHVQRARELDEVFRRITLPDTRKDERHPPIVKRELASYFSSPVLVFLVIFLLLTGFFTFTAGNFFERGEASLAASSVGIHGCTWCSCRVGMRLWAEERRSGTLELLLTMPVAPWQASSRISGVLDFLAVALALTFPAIITVNLLGDPDNGMIARLPRKPVSRRRVSPSLHDFAMTRNQVVASSCRGDLPLPNPRGFNRSPTSWAMGEPRGVDRSRPFGRQHYDGFQRASSTCAIFSFLSVIGFALFATGVIIRGHRSGYPRNIR